MSGILSSVSASFGNLQNKVQGQINAFTNPPGVGNTAGWNTVCFDDTNNLNDASFKGVPFYVEADTTSTGRRIVTHQFPNRDDPFQEDLGQQAVTFKVKGYLAGGNAEAWKDTLLATCAASTPGDLILPYMDATSCVCVSISASRSLEKLGWFDLDMEFRATSKLGLLVSSPAVTGFSLMSMLSNFNYLITSIVSDYLGFFHSVDATITGLISEVEYPALFALCTVMAAEDATQQAVYQLGAALGTPLAGVGGDFSEVEEWLTSRAANRISDLGSAILTAINDGQGTLGSGQASTASTGTLSPQDPAAAAQAPTYLPSDVIAANTYNPPSLMAQITQQCLTLIQNAAQFAQDDPTTGLTRTDFWQGIGDCFNNLTLAFPPRDAARILANLATWTSNPPVSTFGAPSDVRDCNNWFMFVGSVNRIALVALAKVYCSYPFLTRAEAVQTRANLVEQFYQQILNVSYGPMLSDSSVGSALTAARDTVVKAISDQLINLASVQQITAPASMPALYYANMLYQDAERAYEIADENDVIDGLFMPETFLVLSK